MKSETMRDGVLTAPSYDVEGETGGLFLRFYTPVPGGRVSRLSKFSPEGNDGPGQRGLVLVLGRARILRLMGWKVVRMRPRDLVVTAASVVVLAVGGVAACGGAPAQDKADTAVATTEGQPTRQSPPTLRVGETVTAYYQPSYDEPDQPVRVTLEDLVAVASDTPGKVSYAMTFRVENTGMDTFLPSLLDEGTWEGEDGQLVDSVTVVGHDYDDFVGEIPPGKYAIGTSVLKVPEGKGTIHFTDTGTSPMFDVAVNG
ncbi:hypothetical protein ACFT8V_33275 [Streptomyces griseoincarnatus]|uniref:hypothetical protein n=1 Tax=Streptomyces althioticus TaxID=83380 RepID=UPI003329CC78